VLFQLPKLNFAYKDLEPYIDSLTVETHYTKHHQTYCTNLNKAVNELPELVKLSIEQLLIKLPTIPEPQKTVIKNSGGGFYNHNQYWSTLSPKPQKAPTANLMRAINATFGSLDNLKSMFSGTAAKLFGSGWTWLVKDRNSAIEIITTQNQDSPITLSYRPILALDLWEHAYYLKYQNRRADYIEAWWNLVDWKAVGDYYFNS